MNPEKIRDVQIYLTHWHIDHCASLGSFIQHTKARIHIYLHAFHTFGFIGWYYENYPVIAKKVEKGYIYMHFVSDSEYSPFGDYEIKGLQTYLFDDPTLTHGVPNSSPVIRDNKGNFWIVSGDIAFPRAFYRQEVEYFDTSIKNWVGEVLVRSEAAFDDHVKLFFSLGHFWENINTHPYQDSPDNYDMDDFKAKMYADNAAYTNLEVMFIHIKDNYGFSIDLYTPQE